MNNSSINNSNDNDQTLYKDKLYATFFFERTLFEELVSKTSYIHPDMLPICIINFLLQLK